MGLLMKKASQDFLDGITITREFDQANVLRRYVGPQKVDFFGYCLAATGKWLTDPQNVVNDITKQSFQIDTMKMQAEYKGSGLKAPDYLSQRFASLQNLVFKDVKKLVPGDLYNGIIFSSEARLLNQGYVMVGLLDGRGSGHAIGAIINGTCFYFFDASEGTCSFTSKEFFWKFLYKYVTSDNGLFAQGYKDFYVAQYNAE